MACPEVEIVSDGEWSPLEDDEGEILGFPLPKKLVKEELSDIRCCSLIFCSFLSFEFFFRKFVYYFLPPQKVILRSSTTTTPMSALQ